MRMMATDLDMSSGRAPGIGLKRGTLTLPARSCLARARVGYRRADRNDRSGGKIAAVGSSRDVDTVAR
jgi:hypothetical protein